MFKGMEKEAKKARAKTKKLSKEIDRILGALMEEWIGTANTRIESIRKTNNDLQKTIRDIKKGAETAKNILKALGYLDEAIKTAVKLL